MMNKKDYGLWFLLGASILMSLPYAPPFTFIIDDIEFFRYTGMAILKGQVPYRDFFDHKPPMIYFINAAGQALGGWWGLWLISTLFALVITWLFYRLCRQYRLIFPWVLPLLFNLMIRDNLVSEGMHYTREYSTFFVMLFFIALMGKSKYRYFLTGLFAALTFFTQQDQILLLIPFLLYAVVVRDELTFFTRCLHVSAGFLSITALLILYFAINHSLSWFWNDSFAFNFTVYIREKKSIGDHFRTIKRVLDRGNYELPVMVAISLGITSLFVQNKKKPLVVLTLLSIVLSMSSELMGGRRKGGEIPQDLTGYFLPVTAAVCMVLFVVFAFTEDRLITDKKALLSYTLLLCTSLVYTNLQHGTHLPRRNDLQEVRYAELAYLHNQHVGDFQLFIMLDDAYGYYYNELKVLSPTPWLYQQFWVWYDNWDPDQQKLRGIAQDLLRHRTKYLLMNPADLGLMRNRTSAAWWLSFVHEHYEPVPVPGKTYTTLWQLKNTP